MAERKKRRWPYVVGVLAAFVALFVVLHWPSRTKIIISRETTYIDGPLKADGTVDYVAAIDAIYSKGVTPENNAAVLLLQAVGAIILPPGGREEALRRLGNPPLPTEDACFVSLGVWTTPFIKQDGANSLARTGPDLHRRLSEELEQAMVGPWSESSRPLLAQWLNDNADPLEMATAATKRPRFYMPSFSKHDALSVAQALAVPLYPLRDVPRALAARSMQKLGSGDVEGAWSDILANHRLARLMSRGHTVIYRAFGFGIERAATKSGIAVAASGTLDASQAKTMLADLGALSPLADLSELLDRSERFMVLDIVMHMSCGRSLGGMPGDAAGGTNASSSVFDWNQVLREVNQWYDSVVDGLRKPTFAGRAKADEEFRQRAKAQFALSGSGWRETAKVILMSLVGRPFRRALTRRFTRMLLALSSVSFWSVSVDQDIALMYLDLEKLALALAAHKAEKGRFPDSLADLSPSYLKEVPLDRFNDKPLVYRPRADGYILYSVGPNMTDDGGANDQTDKADDLTVEMRAGDGR